MRPMSCRPKPWWPCDRAILSPPKTPAAWEHCMPSQPLPKARLGTAQLHQGRFDDARSTLDQALVDHPNDPHLTRARAELSEREGHSEDAWQRLEPLREHEDPGIRAEAARVALSAGHAEIAQAAAESLLRDTAVPTIVHRRAAFVRARALEAQDQLDLAWNAYVAANRNRRPPVQPRCLRRIRQSDHRRVSFQAR